MYKNTDIKDNQLSDLDAGQVLKDSHNKSEHCLDVNIINSLVPVSYSKEVNTYDGCKLTNIKYYGNGAKNRISLEVPSVYSLDISLLQDRYFLLYSTLNKKYCFYFKVDNVGTQPVIVADFFVAIDIASTNTIYEVTLLIASTISSQPDFTTSVDETTIFIDWRRVGITLGFIDGDTTFSLNKIQLGRALEIVREVDITYDEYCKIISVESV